MKILVCGAQMPFMRGGAEMHMDNLVTAFNAAGHEAALVRLPVAWDKVRLFEAALAWRLIPTDADMVVATNFPSYFVRHERKVVWLFHQHRAAYDAADAPWSDFGDDDSSLEAQRTLAEWDCNALEESRAVFTTSAVVSDRLLRFNGVRSTPLHHPPPLHDRLHPGPYGDYVFSPMRLESNKRPGLVTEAMARWNADLRAVLTGPGSLEAELRRTARRGTHPERLQLTGYLDDARLVEAFSAAFAVVYPPLDEDYGYVTLQAFLAAKPVITTTDSGGVLEWVEDGVTGLVTEPSGEAIAAAVDRLASDRELARRMGEEGRRRVAGLDWQQPVRTLVGAATGEGLPA